MLWKAEPLTADSSEGKANLEIQEFHTTPEKPPKRFANARTVYMENLRTTRKKENHGYDF